MNQCRECGTADVSHDAGCTVGQRMRIREERDHYRERALGAEALVAKLEKIVRDVGNLYCFPASPGNRVCMCCEAMHKIVFAADSVSDTKENHDAEADVVAASDALVHPSADAFVEWLRSHGEVGYAEWVKRTLPKYLPAPKQSDKS